MLGLLAGLYRSARCTTTLVARLVELTNKLAIGDPTDRRSTWAR
jgi:hypothetical protein